MVTPCLEHRQVGSSAKESLSARQAYPIRAQKGNVSVANKCKIVIEGGGSYVS